MSEDQHPLRKIFNEAVEIADAQQRAAYLAAACGADTALLQQIEELVQANAESGRFLGGAGNTGAKAARNLPSATDPGEKSDKPASRRFGDYELLEEIARGGMGVVYRARQRQLDRIVAVKMILAGGFASREQALRFRVEAEAAARLQHPNIVRIHETGEQDGQPYFSMDYVEGGNLARLVREKPLPAKRAAGYVKTIAEAIHYAHEQGILHRDLKPSNVLIDHADQPRVTDFGLAKRMMEESFLTATGDVMGSPGFMPPEQAGAKGVKAGRYSDVYGLGAILFHLVTGRPPFVVRSVAETLHHVLNTEPVSPRLLNPSVPPDIATICLKCLEKEPAQRFQTAQQLADDLGRFLRDEPIRARPAGAWVRTSRWTRRNRIGTALIVVLCAGLSACLVLLQIVSDQKRAHQASLNTLVKSISARVSDLPGSSRPFEHFSAEELRILLNKKPLPKRVASRFTVATLIDLTPMQTLIMFGKLIARIEESIPGTKAGEVRLDLRIYKDYAALRDDLAKGDVHFASVDGRLCLEAQALEPAVRGLVCDQRPGLRTVIFVPADSSISNVAGLKGRSLGIRDKSLFPISFAFEQLAEAGLCAADVRCSALTEDGLSKGERRVYFKKSSAGYFGGGNSTVTAVLEGRAFDAGLAFEWQLSGYREGQQWRRLVTFNTPEFLWVSGPTADASARDGFVRSLLQFKSAKELESTLVDDETDGFAFTTETDKFLENIRAAERAQVRFEQCQPPPNSAVPKILPTSDVPRRSTPNKK